MPTRLVVRLGACSEGIDDKLSHRDTQGTGWRRTREGPKRLGLKGYGLSGREGRYRALALGMRDPEAALVNHPLGIDRRLEKVDTFDIEPAQRVVDGRAGVLRPVDW